MDIEGTYTLQASPEIVWHNLMDAEALLNTVPGIERLEKITDDAYNVTMQIRHAPLKGIYQGHITITEQQFPYHYRIEIQGEGRQNTFQGSGSIHLNRQQASTIIAYKGNLTQDKHSALLPPAVLKGAAKLLIQQFFASLAIQLHSSHPITTIEAKTIETAPNDQSVNGTIVMLPRQRMKRRSTLLQTLLHWGKIGGGDPEEEARWVRRIRRLGTLAGLLTLVWVGTRIPRKK
ncbi:MAG TPA: SRPBCC domain-containing protein [Ktedonobacteraceae bacterium]|jgi:carbon monoxide dehydrogenase subunit G|nr:SRPBCC domain-containing protein [Ktedonobacteraceae bacterium]